MAASADSAGDGFRMAAQTLQKMMAMLKMLMQRAMLKMLMGRRDSRRRRSSSSSRCWRATSQ